MKNVELLTKDTFDNFVQGDFVIVDFWASWCGPCRALAPILDKIAEEQNIKIGKMNIEDEGVQDFTKKFQIRSIPTLLFFKKGQCIGSNVGIISEQDLVAKIKTYEGQ